MRERERGGRIRECVRKREGGRGRMRERVGREDEREKMKVR